MSKQHEILWNDRCTNLVVVVAVPCDAMMICGLLYCVTNDATCWEMIIPCFLFLNALCRKM